MIHVQIAIDLTQEGVEGVRWVLVEPSEVLADGPAAAAATAAAPPAETAETAEAVQRAWVGATPSAAVKSVWCAGVVLALLLAWVGVRPGPVGSPAGPAHRPGLPIGTPARPGAAAVTDAPGAGAPAGKPAPQAAPAPQVPAAPASAPAAERLITASLR